MIPKHPQYLTKISDWTKYRLTFQGGRKFIDEYLYKLSSRESTTDFTYRKRVSYCPAHAKASLNNIQNAIYLRLSDVSRQNGSSSYLEASNGINGGVDNCASTMNAFMRSDVLPELLSIGKVGVYVDKEYIPSKSTKLETDKYRPYIYTYHAEDILNWVYDTQNKLIMLMLCHNEEVLDPKTQLPMGCKKTYRLFRVIDEGVSVTYYDDAGKKTGNALLDLPEIPFVIFELSDSLLVDVADYQIAHLNIASTDISYCINANFPFYTEQFDPRSANIHIIKQDSPEEGKESTDDVSVGLAKGRRYPKNMERPQFISPSTDPLEASIKKQAELKKDIQELVSLAISSLSIKSLSGETKDEDVIEGGLSYIGLELQNGENRIAAIWALYETSDVTQIVYPTTWELRTREDRLKEAKDLLTMLPEIPSKKYQRSISKEVAKLLIGAKKELKDIYSEIDDVSVLYISPDDIRKDVETGILATEDAAIARMHPEGTASRAKEERLERIKATALAQSSGNILDGARMTELAMGSEGKDEKAKSQDDLINGGKKTRGEAK